ncbi:ankyrin repeat [Fusarium falciforme]
MHFLLNHRSSGRVGLFVDLAQKFIDEPQCASNVDEQVTLPFSIFLLDDQRDSTRLSATPMHLAAAYGKEDIVAILINASDLNKKDQDVTALSLALYCGHRRLARMLLENGARPNCSPNISSLHAAARRGFKEEMEQFVKGSKVDPDIEDKDGATPIVYALQQPEKEVWETICFLFYLGAAKDLVVGDGLWTYAELARVWGRIGWQTS